MPKLPEEMDVWGSYFQAALSGYLAAGKLDAQTPGLEDKIVEAAARVAEMAYRFEDKGRRE